MKEELEQIKAILRSLSLITEVQYNRLIDVFGEDMVIDAIKDLYLEDNSILLKLDKLVDNVEINLENDDIGVIDYYCQDVKRENSKINVNKKELIKDVCMLVNGLNELFDKISNLINFPGEWKGFWISDKVNYCINNCSDLELLHKIRILYNEYIEKRNILLQLYLKYVILVARSFNSIEHRVSIEDLIQYGNIGLIRAIELYDVDKNVEFLTYADYWIRQSIMCNSKKIYNSIKVPMHWFDIKSKRGKVFEILTQQLGRYPSYEEVISYMHEDEKKVSMVINAFKACFSLEELIDECYDELSDVISSKTNLSRKDFVVDDTVDLDRDIIDDEMSREIEYYMDLCLNEREKNILKFRYGFMDEMSVLELSKMYGVSEQRIYQMIHRAFDKLLKNSEFRKMKIYLR